jgi:hypothetical protein
MPPRRRLRPARFVAEEAAVDLDDLPEVHENDCAVEEMEFTNHSILQKDSSLKLQRTTLNHVNAFIKQNHLANKPGYE